VRPKIADCVRGGRFSAALQQAFPRNQNTTGAGCFQRILNVSQQSQIIRTQGSVLKETFDGDIVSIDA
jgi:hypothetical protein